MSSSDEGELDRILGGAELDKLETMNLSPQQPDCSQELLGVVPAPTDDAISTAGLAPREGRTGKLQGGGSCQGPSLSFSHGCKTQTCKLTLRCSAYPRSSEQFAFISSLYP